MKSISKKKILLYGGLIGLLFSGILLYMYIQIFFNNVKNEGVLYIYPNDKIDNVVEKLNENSIIKNSHTLKWVMNKKNYSSQIRSGRYIINNGMSNNAIVNKLRSGAQDPINVTFNNIRTKEEFAGVISDYLMIDSLTIISYLNDSSKIEKFGFKKEEIIGMFIPNTYNMYWNISIDEFAERMNREYDAFWTTNKKSKAKEMGLKPIDIITLASIIEEETIKKEEYSKIAGVYINRLKRGIPLSACPTLKFAVGDFTLRRILNKHKKIDSPYNTYKYKGLPPGPIRQPSPEVINAVLNYTKHNYLYFCARYDFSGYHYFSKTLSQHNKYAREYTRELNKRHIYK